MKDRSAAARKAWIKRHASMGSSGERRLGVVRETDPRRSPIMRVEEGRLGLAKGKFRAVEEGGPAFSASNWHETPEAARAELGESIKLREAGVAERRLMDAAIARARAGEKLSSEDAARILPPRPFKGEVIGLLRREGMKAVDASRAALKIKHGMDREYRRWERDDVIAALPKILGGKSGWSKPRDAAPSRTKSSAGSDLGGKPVSERGGFKYKTNTFSTQKPRVASSRGDWRPKLKGPGKGKLAVTGVAIAIGAALGKE